MANGCTVSAASVSWYNTVMPPKLRCTVAHCSSQLQQSAPFAVLVLGPWVEHLGARALWEGGGEGKAYWFSIARSRYMSRLTAAAVAHFNQPPDQRVWPMCCSLLSTLPMLAGWRLHF